MVAISKAALAAAVYLFASSATAQLDTEEPVTKPDEFLGDPSNQQTTNLKVDVSASFPDSEIFGIKLVNGRPTRTVIDVSNHETESIYFMVVGGSLTTPLDTPGAPQTPIILRNLSTSQYGTEIPAGEQQSFTYPFAVEMHPQDLQLNLAAVLQNAKGAVVTRSIYNGTVSVVEAPISFLDPQVIFLYLFLIAAFGGTIFFIYQTWITRLFPQKRRGGKGGERAKRSTGGAKRVDPAEQVSVVGADGPAVTTGAKAYDESWIPAEHLKKPEARRVGSGRPKSRAA